MTLKEFLVKLKDSGIKFMVRENGEIRTKYSRKVLGANYKMCPICALCSKLKKKNYRNGEFIEASTCLGLGRDIRAGIINAADHDLYKLKKDGASITRGEIVLRNKLLDLCENKEKYATKAK